MAATVAENRTLGGDGLATPNRDKYNLPRKLSARFFVLTRFLVSTVQITFDTLNIPKPLTRLFQFNRVLLCLAH